MYHFIPLRSETGEDKDWMEDKGFLDNPDDFICDLVDSKLFVSLTALHQLTNLAFPNNKEQATRIAEYWWDEQLSRKNLAFKDDSYQERTAS